MARTIEAEASQTLSSFSIKVYVAGAFIETIVMAHEAAEPGTWRGTIANVLSVGEAKVNYHFNGSATANGRFHADISATDGSTSYCRDLVKVELPFRNATAAQQLTGTSVGLTSAAIAAIWAALTSGLTAVGSIGKLIVDVLSLMTGGSSGARTVTIAVNDGVTVLQNALVRLSQGAETYVATTNASGIATLSVNDATWTVGITKVGYSFTPTTLVVDGNETVTYSMSAILISPPADPAFCTLAIRVWGAGTSVVAVGVTVSAQVIEAPTGTGEAFDNSVMTDDTGADGYATFTVPKRSTVKYWIDDSMTGEADSARTDTSIAYVDNFLGHEE